MKISGSREGFFHKHFTVNFLCNYFLVEGILRSYDPGNNIILDDCIEFLQGFFALAFQTLIYLILIGSDEEFGAAASSQPQKPQVRHLGRIMVRGVSIVCVYPAEESQEIDCPYQLDDQA